MGNACSSCCGGVYFRSSFPLLTQRPGRRRGGLYDTTMAEREREAVAELLGFLENVRAPDQLYAAYAETDHDSHSVPTLISSREILYAL